MTHDDLASEDSTGCRDQNNQSPKGPINRDENSNQNSSNSEMIAVIEPSKGIAHIAGIEPALDQEPPKQTNSDNDSKSNDDISLSSSTENDFDEDGDNRNEHQSIELLNDCMIQNYEANVEDLVQNLGSQVRGSFSDKSHGILNRIHNDPEDSSTAQEPQTSTDETITNMNLGSNNFCYNSKLDDQIRSKLDKLNALSDLINSLERQFDGANSLFSETLKQSTDRLSSLAKIIGKRSIKYGRAYHATRLSVEQSQNECQTACIEFEKATKDHQEAKLVINQAELMLSHISDTNTNVADNKSAEIPDIQSLNLGENEKFDKSAGPDTSETIRDCDKVKVKPDQNFDEVDHSKSPAKFDEVLINGHNTTKEANASSDTIANKAFLDAAKFNQQLDQAILRLSEAERRRSDCQKSHLDKANKLMVDQNNLLELERNHGHSIKRSQLYFEEARRFNGQLNSVKSDITQIREQILAAKSAYSDTLKELEQFSEELHDISSKSCLTNFNPDESESS